MTYCQRTQLRILSSIVTTSSSLGRHESGRTLTPLVSLSPSRPLDEPTKAFSLQEKLSRWWSIEANLEERNSYHIVYGNLHNILHVYDRPIQYDTSSVLPG